MAFPRLFVMNRPAKVALGLSFLLGAGLLGLILFSGWSPLWETVVTWWDIISDPKQVEALKESWGPLGGPLAFIGLQILQVVLAPFPGEASGFVGGYLFGVMPGLVYSTIGLTIGSVINFALGRTLGRRYVTRWMSVDSLARFDSLAKHQGTILFFSFFIFPGFPKDYLCIFLGLTALSFKVFVLMAGVGRIPGTLMLTLQGAQVFERDFTALAILIAITVAFVIPAYLWRQRIYGWVDRLDSGAINATTPGGK
jgi:uncharacterized membrane protein YdjX (TVP38/TMEM64 family)